MEYSMEVLRLKIKQNQANYRKEETVDNKMTYPLPPLSTIIGAIHSACNFKEYKSMNISIQGKYDSLEKRMYTNHAFLNSINDDRDILVKLFNDNMLSKGYIKVAKALEKNSKSKFSEKKLIKIYNEDLLNEFIKLKKIKEMCVKRKKTLEEKKKKLAKGDITLNVIVDRIKEIIALKQRCEFKYNKFANLNTAPMYYEILSNIELVIHIESDIDTLNIIKNNIYSLKCIGRSEDFVEIEEVKPVKLFNNIDREYESKYSAYVDYNLVKNEDIIVNRKGKGIPANGTRYKLNKDYIINDDKRIFNKKDVLYVSNYVVDKESSGVYVDEDRYIVNLL